jgi:hypothetical protein
MESDEELIDRLDRNRDFWSNEEVDKLLSLARRGAAAGDVLEALKETLVIAKRNEVGDYVARAEAAILKAEGEK